MQVTTDWVDENVVGSARWEGNHNFLNQQARHEAVTGEALEWCPDQGDQVALAARQLVTDHLPLLVPAQQPPTGALVGKPVLLQLGRDPQVELFDLSLQVLGRSFTVSGQATATTTIDWGDGSVDRDIERRGATYDQVDGNLDDPRLISHTYQDVGTYDVAITDVWSGSITVSGFDGTFPFTARLDDTVSLELQQAQAVVTNQS